MTEQTDELERALAADLATLGDRLTDERFCTELYRALTNTAWSRRDGAAEGHIALSWTLAERLVNDLRDGVGREPLELAQTGGEGEVAHAVQDEMARLGWTHRPLNTSRHDDRHESEPAESPPPPDTGIRQGPPEAQSEEERFARAHEVAHENRRRSV